MRTRSTYLAVDLGASSGRVMAGHFDGSGISLEELHRFENGGIRLGSHLYWGLPGLWKHILAGLRNASQQCDSVTSVGVDTWGVDFGLLARGELLGLPVMYRDRRTAGMLEKAFAVVPREEIFAETGLQFLELNTLYQILAMAREPSPLLAVADQLLLMPDLFHWLLSGETANERTNASTTQLYNPRTGAWSSKLIDAFELPRRVFGTIADPGTRLGALRADVQTETGLRDVGVVIPATHDTASAIVAAPADRSVSATPAWCYISSGTWSLVGVEVPAPVISAECREFNFTNEVGYGDTVRLLRNMVGLWLLQECRRSWQLQGHDFTWEKLTALAERAAALRSLIDVDDPRLLAPSDMPQTIAEICRETNQPVPESPGAVIRCALESLAIGYRRLIDQVEIITGGRIETIHVFGGGCQNRMLNQLTANASQRPVIAGPVEATALGNCLVQVIAAGELADVAEARRVVRASTELETFTPHDADAWDAARARVGKA